MSAIDDKHAALFQSGTLDLGPAVADEVTFDDGGSKRVYQHGVIRSNVMVPPPQHLKPKSRAVMDWFSANNQPLRRLVCVLSEGATSAGIRVACMRMHGSGDL
jgi:hypothetical protein